MNDKPPSLLTRLALRLHNYWQGTRVWSEGSGHCILWNDARVTGTTLWVQGRGGRIEFGRQVRLLDCEVIIRGTAPKLVIDEQVRLTRVRIVVEDQGSLLRIGAKTSMTGATLQAKEGKRLEFGRDCMVGHGVEVANSDSHSLIDANSGERTNSARDVVIGSHVWIAAGATVAKGVRIGQGAVVAAGSRVLRDVPEQTLVAGCPATVRRTDVRWARERIGVTL